MAQLGQKLANVLQYFGVRSNSYYHSEATANYHADQPLAYYLDHTARAGYDGPTDSEGIPQYNYNGTVDYLPVLVALIGLGHGDLYLRTDDTRDRDTFISYADWFVRSQTSAGAWLTSFPMKKYGLEGNFPSAMSQGMGMSMLVRAHLLTGEARYLESATAALDLFDREVSDGGVRTITDGRVFYEEYPSAKPHHVLNGFIYAVWGLYDLIRVEKNVEAHRLWDLGLATLIEWLPRFDSGRWSWYHIGEGMKNPATIPYHKLHIEQLRVMHAITGHEIFHETANRWQGYLQGRFNALSTLPRKIAWNLFRGL